jgi:hypothetical protein
MSAYACVFETTVPVRRHQDEKETIRPSRPSNAACTDSYRGLMTDDYNDQVRRRKHQTRTCFALRGVEAHVRMPTDGLASFGGSAVCLD